MLRKAKPTDIPAIYPLILTIWQDMSFPLLSLLPEDIFYQTMLDLMARPSAKFSYQNAWVYEKDTKVVGILFGYDGNKENDFDEDFFTFIDDRFPELNIRQYRSEREALDNEWYLDSLVVAADQRNQGIAQQFFKHLSDFTDQTCIGLNCDLENPRAFALYERIGFKTVQQTTFLGHTYYHMQKQLN